MRMKRKPNPENAPYEMAASQRPPRSGWKIGKRITPILFICMFPACSSVPMGAPIDSMPETVEPATPANPDDALQTAYSRFALAAIAASRGDFEAAQQYLSTAIEKDPNSAYLSRKMALLLKKMKDYPRAL